MLKIVTAEEPIFVENVCILIYGSPGLGKTSLGFSAADPLMLDFDNGAKRAYRRGDSVQVNQWSDVSNMSGQDVSGYKTIVVDTVGRLLDAMSISIIAQNPKMKGFGGALSLQGYGALKASYTAWLKTLMSYGKDIVLIAHDKEDKKGDDLIVRPDIQGSSLGEVFKRADGVAYLHQVGKQRTLDFSPTDEWIGKNTAQFPSLAVPHLSTEPQFLGRIISELKTAMNSLSEEQKKVVAEVDGWRDMINGASDADTINSLIPDIKQLKEPVLSQVKHILAARSKELSLMPDKATGLYSEAA